MKRARRCLIFAGFLPFSLWVVYAGFLPFSFWVVSHWLGLLPAVALVAPPAVVLLLALRVVLIERRGSARRSRQRVQTISPQQGRFEALPSAVLEPFEAFRREAEVERAERLAGGGPCPDCGGGGTGVVFVGDFACIACSSSPHPELLAADDSHDGSR